jgi:hypothetical protein
MSEQFNGTAKSMADLAASAAESLFHAQRALTYGGGKDQPVPGALAVAGLPASLSRAVDFIGRAVQAPALRGACPVEAVACIDEAAEALGVAARCLERAGDLAAPGTEHNGPAGPGDIASIMASLPALVAASSQAVGRAHLGLAGQALDPQAASRLAGDVMGRLGEALSWIGGVVNNFPLPEARLSAIPHLREAVELIWRAERSLKKAATVTEADLQQSRQFAAVMSTKPGTKTARPRPMPPVPSRTRGRRQ